MIDLCRKGRSGRSECAKGSIELFYGFFTDFDEYTLEARKKTLLFRLEKREDHYKITQENPEHKHAVRKLNSRPFSATQENYMAQAQQKKKMKMAKQ